MIKVTCSNKAKNGLEIVLLNVSYNAACFWLDNELRKHGSNIKSCRYDPKNDFNIIETGSRSFYYSELDGILYGE